MAGEGKLAVTLTFPSALENIRLARLITSAVAAQAGFPIDVVEDLRIGVDELCSLLIDAADPAGDVTMTLWVNGQRMTIAASAPAGGEVVLEGDELSAHILEATVDHHELKQEEGTLRASLEKTLVP